MGEICHIESAEPGGPRFNPEQTDEDRRRFENLIILCANHHRFIDDPDLGLSADDIRRFKASHEELFQSQLYTPPRNVITKSLNRLAAGHESRAAYIAAFSLLRCAFQSDSVRVYPRGPYAYSVERSSRRTAVFVEPVEVFYRVPEPIERFAERSFHSPYFKERFREWAKSNSDAEDIHLLILVNQSLDLDADDYVGGWSIAREVGEIMETALDVASELKDVLRLILVACATYDMCGNATPIKKDRLSEILYQSSKRFGGHEMRFDMSAQTWYLRQSKRFSQNQRRGMV